MLWRWCDWGKRGIEASRPTRHGRLVMYDQRRTAEGMKRRRRDAEM